MPDSCSDAPSSARDPGQPTIFLVDGDEAVRDAVASALRAAGFRACAFGSGQQFLEAYSFERPACLVVDLDLPDMDGIALLGMLAAAERALPTIVTSRRLHRRGIASMFAPPPAVLEKPFGVDDLLPLIRDAVAMASAAARR
jgi:two-component system, LuxR family, response regulator FixJ